MPFKTIRKIWMNGRLVDFEDATIHVLSHVVHYGSGIFEGMRCYKTPEGPAVFRLQDHIRRLYDGCRVYRMEIPIERDEFEEACLETIRANELEDCYVRPLVYRGVGAPGLLPDRSPVEVMIAAWGWGAYLGKEGLEKGVDVRISSWNRMAPNTFPAMTKATANYLNSQLVRIEAALDGYEEGIALDVDGYVSEGSGENIFVVRDGIIQTPPLGASILPGITRDAVMKIANDLGFEIVQMRLPREVLYLADEVFFTGTAAEVTPVRSIDRIPVGEGSRGPITQQIQERFFQHLRGEVEDRYGWLTRV
ncbi:MAG: branched-chain amino acid transaminase [Thermoanaerobaculia bacterium]|nr:branched-chain amino acid transaminase [Thermoanaerobaculia bacterium]